MKLVPIILSTITVLLIVMIQWPSLKKKQKKEKFVFFILTGFGWSLANTLAIFPDLPGPTQIIDFTFKPLGKFLE